MKRTINRLCSFTLACVVAVCGLMSAPVTASATNEIRAGQPTIEANSTGVVFAGHTWVVVADKGNAFGMDTGKTDTNCVTLLLKNGDAAYDTSFFNTAANNYNHIYAGSKLHAIMETTIYGDFSAQEQAMVAEREINQIAETVETEDGTLTGQHVWPLSRNEWDAIKAGNNGQSVLAFSIGNTSPSWWLRSPYIHSDKYVWVGLPDGSGKDYSALVGLAVRPAFNLNLSSVLFTSAAAGGKPATEGQTLTQVEPLTGTDTLKFTMQDDKLSLSNVEATSVSGNTVTFSYDAATTDVTGHPYNALSAIVTDSSGNLKYYGHLDNTPAHNGTGTASVTVPDGLDPTDNLLVFIEQANADSANMTDFASQPVSITRAAPTGLSAIAPTSYKGNDGKITGTTADMEYSSNNGTTWKNCTTTATTGLAAGTYRVRFSGKVNGIQDVLASSAVTVTVDEGLSVPAVGKVSAPAAVNVGGTLALSAPKVTWNGGTGARGWQISPNGSTGWKEFNQATTMTAAHNGQYLRYYATNNKGTGYSNKVKLTVSSVKVKGIKLNVEAKTLKKGKSYTFQVIVSPVNATNQKVTWSSSKTKVATVGKTTGKVTAKKNGTTIITATTADGKKTAKAKLTVGGTAVKKVTLNKKSVTIKKKKSVTLTATVKPAAATYKGIIWRSSNDKIAKVTAKGKVTGVKKGSAKITVSTKDGNKKAVCKVKVK